MKTADSFIRDAQNGIEITDEALRESGYGLKYAEWSSKEAEGLGLRPGWFEVQQDLMARYAALPKAAPVHTARPLMVRCDCGHTVAKILVMSTSNGSSCPECYDRMSD